MKKNRKYIIYILVLGVFVIYQLSANYIFNVLVRTEQESKLVDFSLPPESDVVKFNVDEVKKVKLKWKDGLYLRGWDFKLPIPKEKKDVYLVLKSTNSTRLFKVKDNNIPRPDVLSFFKLESGKFKKGFEMVIPLYILDDDVYRIGFVIEDETGKYYSTSTLELRKSGDDFKVVDFKAAAAAATSSSEAQSISGPAPESVSQQVTLGIKKPTKETNYNFDSVYKSGKFLNLRGWGFIDGLDAKSLTTYILLKNNKGVFVFDVRVEPRKGVTEFFGKTGLNLDSAGFQSVIPTGNLESGSYQLGLYFSKGNHVGVAYTQKFIEISN
jgi:hypothetical protein